MHPDITDTDTVQLPRSSQNDKTGMVKDAALPRWWVACSAVCIGSFVAQPWLFNYYAYYGVPIQIYLLLFLSMCGVFVGAYSNIKKIFTTTEWVAVFTIIVSVLAHGLLDGNGVSIESFRNTTRVMSGVLIALLAGAIVLDRKNWNFAIKLLAIAAAATAAVAILQELGVAEWSRQVTVYALYPIGKPATGLDSSPVTYSYSILGISIIIGCSSFARIFLGVKTQNSFVTFVYAFIVCGIVLGIVFAESRSGFLGFVVGFFAFFLFTRRATLMGAVIPLVLVVLAFMAVSMVFSEFETKRQGGVTKDARLVQTWSTFMPIIMDYPLGLPVDSETLRKSPHMSEYQTARLAFARNGWYDPHNIFMTTAVSFGVPAAVAQIWLYFSVVWRAIRVRPPAIGNRRSPEWIVVKALAAANIAIFIHSWFHNPNLATVEMRNWFWVGACAMLASHLAAGAEAELTKRPQQPAGKAAPVQESSGAA